MFCKSYCATVIGVEAQIVQVEADVSDGLPVFHMVGYLGSEVKEASERVRSAIKNMGYHFLPKRITVNMSPADIRKDGTAFDVAVAMALLAAFGYVNNDKLGKVVMVGELSLNGKINGVNGVLPVVIAARENGFSYCVVPKENYKEACKVNNINIIPASLLSEVVDIINNDNIDNLSDFHNEHNDISDCSDLDFSDISGQKHLKRAAMIAISGRHNMLIIGSPGTGKTMLAERLPSIMPELTEKQRMEVSAIASVCGDKSYLSGDNMPPFRNPHYSISPTGLIGGGNYPYPGEITRAHNGILFLDELTEFKKDTLELLRLPLESGNVVHARNTKTITYPSNFILVAAMNPCPCGYFPDIKKCRCNPSKIRQYLNKISFAFLDRIDIIIETENVNSFAEENENKEKTSPKIRKQVENTVKIQEDRYKTAEYDYNAELDNNGIKRYCVLDKDSRDMLRKISEDWGLSARSYNKIIKVARTIADFEGCNDINVSHISEAIFYRRAEYNLWMKKGGIIWN